MGGVGIILLKKDSSAQVAYEEKQILYKLVHCYIEFHGFTGR